MRSDLELKVKSLPLVPGVYIYSDAKAEIIYVGKAKSLRNRVGSYFQNNLDPFSKTQALVDHIADLKYIEVGSELEALILEAELIKKYRPKYNINLKDDKSYIYIVIRSEKMDLDGKKVVLPKVQTERKPDLAKNDTIFGPYPDGQTAKTIVRTLRKIIPYRDCQPSKFARYAKLGKPCLYGHINLCSAPCVGRISVAAYRKDIDKIKKIMRGQSKSVVNAFEREMQHYAKIHDYETAARYRDMIQKFTYITQTFKTAQSYIDNPYLIEDLLNKSLQDLMKSISILPKTPYRIECYDISNISGKEAVGSMVVATNGRIDKKEYKKFRIKLQNEPNDFGMLQEVLRRRLNHSNWPAPDLLLIDGGKGQVSAVMEVVDDLKLKIPVCGLAKRIETLVYKKDGEFIEVNPDLTNEGLKLAQRLRDEAHRFAQAYHHKLMLKKMIVKKAR